MPNILEASVKLFAEDSQLRASFQGLAPQAHLAGITAGDRFAAGIKKSVEAAHAAFQKEFIGPLQTETFGALGRGMAVPTQQYRASDLALQKSMAAATGDHTKALVEHAKVRATVAQTSGGFFKSLFTEPEAGGGESAGGSGGEGGGHSAMAKFAHTARIIAHDTVPALQALNPPLAQFIQAGAASARTAVFFGAAIGGVAIVGAVLSEVIGKYIEKAQAATTFTFQLGQATKNLDLSRATSEFSKADEEISRFALNYDLLSGKVQSTYIERELARAANFVEHFTGSVEANFGRAVRAAGDAIGIFNQTALPKAQASERVFNAGLLEREAQLNIQTAHSVEELNAAYDKSVKSIHDRTDAEIAGLQVELAKQTAAQNTGAAALTQIELNKKLGAQAADLAAKEYERQRAAIRFTEARQAHAVEMGRVTMQAQIEFDRAAATDSRRTIDEREAAEKKLFRDRREMADSVLKFQENITGKSNFKEQLEVQRGFLAEITEAGGTGSKVWLDHTAKIADLYRQIREEAKAIFSQQASIAEGEAGRQFEEQKKLTDARRAAIEDENIVSANVAGKEAVLAAQERIRQRREGREGVPTEPDARLSMSDIPGYLNEVRRRDEGALRGDRVPVGDLSAAVGRMDLFRKMDKEGLSPREAFSRLTEDPSKQLARAIEGLTGGASDVTPVLTGLADAATLATRALLALAGVPQPNGSGTSQSGPAERQRGGPALSEDNRQAILDAISTRLTDENLAVYGRR